jgi:hypothetical protein
MKSRLLSALVFSIATFCTVFVATNVRISDIEDETYTYNQVPVLYIEREILTFLTSFTFRLNSRKDPTPTPLRAKRSHLPHTHTLFNLRMRKQGATTMTQQCCPRAGSTIHIPRPRKARVEMGLLHTWRSLHLNKLRLSMAMLRSRKSRWTLTCRCAGFCRCRC